MAQGQDETGGKGDVAATSQTSAPKLDGQAQPRFDVTTSRSRGRCAVATEVANAFVKASSDTTSSSSDRKCSSRAGSTNAPILCARRWRPRRRSLRPISGRRSCSRQWGRRPIDSDRQRRTGHQLVQIQAARSGSFASGAGPRRARTAPLLEQQRDRQLALLYQHAIDLKQLGTQLRRTTPQVVTGANNSLPSR